MYFTKHQSVIIIGDNATTHERQSEYICCS